MHSRFSPTLSAIVISLGDEQSLIDAVQSVVSQKTSDPSEVIAVSSGSDQAPELVRDKFTSVRVIALE